MRKFAPLAAMAAASVIALAACAGGTSPVQSSSASNSGSAPSDRVYRIGISQIQAHPALDAVREGFKQELKDAGLKATYSEKNAQGDQSTAANIAGGFKTDNVDLIVAIATPTAQAAVQAITDIPILVTAVTDPVDAGLVDSLEKPGRNVTGTTDANPVKEQLQLIKDIVPTAKTVGIVYSTSEANSLIQVEWAKTAAKELGLTITEAPAPTTADVLQAAETVDADAIWVPVDNTVVTALESVLQVGEAKKIPVFVGDADSVARGAIGTFGIDYYELGRQTGQMAIKILVDGQNPGDMPIESLNNPTLYLNPGAAERMGVKIPQSVLDRADPANITK